MTYQEHRDNIIQIVKRFGFRSEEFQNACMFARGELNSNQRGSLRKVIKNLRTVKK